jgi:hypothetical protein
MIRFEQARQIAIDEYLPRSEAYVRGKVTLVDSEEHEWGWVFYIEAVDPASCGLPDAHLYGKAVLIDRILGLSQLASPSGLPLSIDRFLEARDERLKQSRDGTPDTTSTA